MFCVQQDERWRKLAQRHCGCCAAAGSGNDYRYFASRRVVWRLQVNLPRTDRDEVRVLSIDLNLGIAERSGKIAVPVSDLVRQVIAENGDNFAWLDGIYGAIQRNYAIGRYGRR